MTDLPRMSLGGAGPHPARTASAALALAALVAGAVPMLGATATASAARYVAKPAGGGRIVLEVDRGRLRRVHATLPARCESNTFPTPERWRTRLEVDLSGSLALRSGRFAIQGRASNRVRYQVGGRLRAGAISGRVRLTFFDLDVVGPSDDSYLCDTGTRRYRARRSR